MTYTAADTKLQGRNHRSRKIANNTYLERRQDGVIAVRLHNTDVVTLYSDGRVVLNSGGWRTSTTAQRINSYSPVGVFQHKFQWYVASPQMHSQGNAAFSEGVTIHPDGSITGTLAGCVRSYAARAAETEPADPIGVLVDGSTVFCFGCELLNAHKVFLYRVNVYPYKQACTKCGKALVEPQSPSWPELFTWERKVS